MPSPAQGGEFAFVLLALASQLEVLPAELNRLLIIVVVLSMALTPFLTELGKTIATRLETPGSGGEPGLGLGALGALRLGLGALVHGSGMRCETRRGPRSERQHGGPPRRSRAAPPPAPPPPPLAPRPTDLLSAEGYNMEDPVVVLSFGDVGQTVANMLSSPALGRTWPYVVFDLTVARVQAAQEAGFNVLYGDGGRPKVLHAAGIERPRAVVVCYTARQRSVLAVEALHSVGGRGGVG